MGTLAVSATAHGANYLPEYLAREHGIFASHSLDVPYRPRNPWDGVMHDLADGSADVALGGLWVPAMYAGNGRNFVAVAQLNDRFPMAIVTREPARTSHCPGCWARPFWRPGRAAALRVSSPGG